VRPASKIEAATVLALLLTASSARAEPLRLRADAFARTRPPVGLLVLEGQDRLRPWIDAEGLAWLGTEAGDVLTLSVRARHLTSGSEIRVGRMLVSTGAIRPVHVDGVRALGRVFGHTTLEAFGGFPVVRRGPAPSFEALWTAGGRLGQAIGDVASFGAAWALRRGRDGIDRREVGADAAFTPAPWLTAAGRMAIDAGSGKPADALASVGLQRKDQRLELFVTHRSPGRLLPATSLFSMLGDHAATNTGATLRWRAFPRLELVTTGSVETRDTELGGQGLGRATLALDDAWRGSVGGEARRVHVGESRWSGIRAFATVPLSARVNAAVEAELVRADRESSLWPWALAALGFSPTPSWDVSGAVEASSGPAYKSSVAAIARVGWTFAR